MLKFLKNHPFAVEAHFERSLVLTFAIPKAQLEGLIPNRLTLDTFQDKWAFIAVAMVQTRNLRPKGFPAICGNDFFLIGYRVFVRYPNIAGKRLRGLYILLSETNKRKMQFLGNIFTHYNYTTTDVQFSEYESSEVISSEHSQFNVVVDQHKKDVELPPDSPFDTWKEARRFAGPLPFTFTCDSENQSVLIIEGVRNNWRPEPVHINDYSFQFLNELGFENTKLANAFQVTDVPYSWKKGVIESWK